MANGDHTALNIDGFTVLIDTRDIHIGYRFAWHVAKKRRMSYVCASTTSDGKRIHLYLHRMILGVKCGELCDHINGDTLDNRRCNLRIVNAEQNSRNASKKPSRHGNRFRGISTRSYGFASQIRVDGKIKCLGTFRTDIEAAYAYDMASLEYHGQYGRRNFLPLAHG